MKLAKIVIILSIVSAFVFSATEFSRALGKYVPLAPIPGFTETPDVGNSDVEGYLKKLYIFGVGIASILAVMMIIWGGIEYITTDAIGHKEEGKQKIQSAVMGLILAFGSFVILKTINADLVNINFTLWRSPLAIEKIGKPVYDTSLTYELIKDMSNSANDAITVGNSSGVPSGNKVKLDSSIAYKDGSQVDATLAPKLKSLDDQLDRAGIGWRVTEAWPPSGYSESNPKGIHQNACHGTGMCVDANFSGGAGATPNNINTFHSSASQSGLRAVYEVRSSTRKNELIAQGVTGEIAVVPQITGEHFSVYNKN